jgi:hypothetical protein
MVLGDEMALVDECVVSGHNRRIIPRSPTSVNETDRGGMWLRLQSVVTPLMPLSDNRLG